MFVQVKIYKKKKISLLVLRLVCGMTKARNRQTCAQTTRAPTDTEGRCHVLTILVARRVFRTSGGPAAALVLFPLIPSPSWLNRNHRAEGSKKKARPGRPAAGPKRCLVPNAFAKLTLLFLLISQLAMKELSKSLGVWKFTARFTGCTGRERNTKSTSKEATSASLFLFRKGQQRQHFSSNLTRWATVDFEQIGFLLPMILGLLFWPGRFWWKIGHWSCSPF